MCSKQRTDFKYLSQLVWSVVKYFKYLSRRVEYSKYLQLVWSVVKYFK
jgi:hypothetical protein